PIVPDRLIATLDLAAAAQNANADTSTIQHVVLSGALPASATDGATDPEESSAAGNVELEEQPFPAPRPAPRMAPAEHRHAQAVRVAARFGAPRSRLAPTPLSRRTGVSGAPMARPAIRHSAARNVSPRSIERDRNPPPERLREGSGKPVRFPPANRASFIDAP